jgi:hypothetical protein
VASRRELCVGTVPDRVVERPPLPWRPAKGYKAQVNARLVRRFLWVAGFGCLWLPVLDDPPLSTGAYVQDVTQVAATVAMITAQPAQLSCVALDREGKVVGEVVGPPERRRHALRITGLHAGTDYRYAVSRNGTKVAEGHIRTAPADDRAPVRFAFLGDSGGLPWWVWLQTSPALNLPARWGWMGTSYEVTAIGERIAAFAPDFVMHLGDIVYPWGRNAQYSAGFFRPFAAAMSNAPFYAVLGNHDLMDAAGLQALANLRLPKGSLTGDSRCYSFSWGAVRVIALDCDPDHGGGRYEPGHPAYEFLQAQLATCAEPWILVVSHFPIRSASRARNNPELMKSMLPVLQENQVSLYLSGHDHCYQRFGPAADGSGVPLIVSGGGGKSLYEVRPDKAAAVLQSQYHWCSAEASGDQLLVRAHAVDGSLLDAVALQLPVGSALEALRSVNPARAARIEALRGK